MREPFETRFRCSGYPECRRYEKIVDYAAATEKPMEPSIGGAMISPSFDFGEFIQAVKDKGYLEMLGLADKEALEAWRQSLSRKGETGNAQDPVRKYESTLKEFVYFMRAAVFPKKERDPHHQLFHSVREALLKKEPASMRA
jgi:hypothetical protein